jgi:hypothetical protein
MPNQLTLDLPGGDALPRHSYDEPVDLWRGFVRLYLLRAEPDRVWRPDGGPLARAPTRPRLRRQPAVAHQRPPHFTVNVVLESTT